jgi:hypothetical protein
MHYTETTTAESETPLFRNPVRGPNDGVHFNGGDALVSAATGLARETIRKGRRELDNANGPTGRLRRAGAGRPPVDRTQPGVQRALEALVDPLTRGDTTSALRWTCKSKAKLAAALAQQGWTVSASTVGRLLHAMGYCSRARYLRLGHAGYLMGSNRVTRSSADKAMAIS